MSTSMGYEFAIGRGMGLQIRADFTMSDFKYNGGAFYPSYNGDYHYYDDWNSSLDFFSLGVALMFGK